MVKHFQMCAHIYEYTPLLALLCDHSQQVSQQPQGAPELYSQIDLDPWETDPSLSLTCGKWVTHMSYLEWLDSWRALSSLKTNCANLLRTWAVAYY